MKQNDIMICKKTQKLGLYQESPSPWVKISSVEFSFELENFEILDSFKRLQNVANNEERIRQFYVRKGLTK